MWVWSVLHRMGVRAYFQCVRIKKYLSNDSLKRNEQLIYPAGGVETTTKLTISGHSPSNKICILSVDVQCLTIVFCVLSIKIFLSATSILEFSCTRTNAINVIQFFWHHTYSPTVFSPRFVAFSHVSLHQISTLVWFTQSLIWKKNEQNWRNIQNNKRNRGSYAFLDTLAFNAL